ncbi:MAG: ADP-dependent glucokinase/phosphofructokinase [Salinigranum sp.]
MVALARHLAAIREAGVFCAYNANVDAIVDVDGDVEDALDPPHDRELDRIESPADLATAIVRTMERGEGDEIAAAESFEGWFGANLRADERRLGGQAGIMADFLSLAGATPILYTYLLSDAQRSTFRDPETVLFPVVDGGLQFRPLSSAPTAAETKTNWIFEFDRGTRLFGTTATESTRLIAASRPEAFDLETGGLAAHARELGRRVDCAILSGYHSLKAEYADGTTDADHLESGRRFLSELGRETTVQVEYGVTHDEALREAIVERIAPLADVVSVDVRELGLLAADLGVGPPDDDVRAHRDALREVREALGVRAVKLHAREYFLAVTDGYLPPERVREGFRFAAVVAAAKATHGRLADPSQLDDGAAVEPSAAGAEAAAAVAEDADVVAVPNRVVEDETGTVGIGDVVSCSSFALEQALSAGE